MLGKASGRDTPETITLSQSVDVAVQDLVVAHMAIENARATGTGQTVAM